MDVIAAYRPTIGRCSVIEIVRNGEHPYDAKERAKGVFSDATSFMCFRNFTDWNNAVAVIEDGKDDGVFRFGEPI